MAAVSAWFLQRCHRQPVRRRTGGRARRDVDRRGKRVGGEVGIRPPRLPSGGGACLARGGQTNTTVILAKLGRDAQDQPTSPGRRLGGALNPWRTSGSRVMGRCRAERGTRERERSLPHIGRKAALLPRAGAQQGQREGTLQSLPGAWPRHCPKPWPPPSPASLSGAPPLPSGWGVPNPRQVEPHLLLLYLPRKGFHFCPSHHPVLCSSPPASRGGCSKRERLLGEGP